MNWQPIPAKRGEKRWRLDGGTEWELSESNRLFTIIENPDRLREWGRNVRWIERTKAEEMLAEHLRVVKESR